MASLHTYYLAFRDRFAGERAGDEAVCAALRTIWNASVEQPEPTQVDGVSAWRDAAGRLEARLVVGAACRPVTDPAHLAALEDCLNPS